MEGQARRDEDGRRLRRRWPRATAGSAVTAAVALWVARHATSPTRRAWRPGRGQIHQAGPLTVRTSGTGGTALVLLHGLPASGDVFGAGLDDALEDTRLVVPDLLGFGRSRDADRSDFSLPSHLDALDAMAESLGFGSSRLVVAGHSMGGLLAVSWAARHAEQVDAVVTWSAPVFHGSTDARRRLNAKAPGLAWVGLPGSVSRTLCEQLCTRRPWLAQWLYVAVYPRLPVPLARQLTRHTWASYRDTMTGVVLDDSPWRGALDVLERAGVPVVHATGARDALAPADALGARGAPGTEVSPRSTVIHPTADHLLPLDHPQWCTELLRTVMQDPHHPATPAG